MRKEAANAKRVTHGTGWLIPTGHSSRCDQGIGAAERRAAAGPVGSGRPEPRTEGRPVPAGIRGRGHPADRRRWPRSHRLLPEHGTAAARATCPGPAPAEVRGSVRCSPRSPRSASPVRSAPRCARGCRRREPVPVAAGRGSSAPVQCRGAGPSPTRYTTARRHRRVLQVPPRSARSPRPLRPPPSIAQHRRHCPQPCPRPCHVPAGLRDPADSANPWGRGGAASGLGMALRAAPGRASA